MHADAIFPPLAASLAQCDWTVQDVESHLRQRLPRGWEKTPATLARWLVEVFPGTTAPDPARLSLALQGSPAAQRLVAHARKTRSRPKPWLEPPVFRPPPALADLALPQLATPNDLADWLALSSDQLIRFTDPHGLSARNPVHFARHYHCHLIPKRDGTLRLIEEPKPLLKRLQGFVRGRNCITAAAKHAGEAVVLSFDLADFFPTVAWTRIYAIFRSLGYSQAVARALAPDNRDHPARHPANPDPRRPRPATAPPPAPRCAHLPGACEPRRLPA
ncbi:MAG: hypothetical protein MUE52_19725 [Tabrizicola sp.]|nr:hypothetical protein [Tabrizicola sp.]